jgi:putative ABC transport system ATP-binding protein
MIKLSHIYKEYKLGSDIITVLCDINLEIKDGEYCAILGPSGSGKSTLMHIIGLLDQPSKGNVIIQNKDISKLDDNDLSTLRNEYVGFVFQQFNLINKLTIEENILLPTVYAKIKLKYNPVEKARELMTRFNIIEKANSYPNKISGGQQQRVSIARALIMNPSLILADEPTGNLDTKNGNAILDLIEDLNKKDKITVVIVTHEADVARRARREIKIVDGEIVK